MEDLISKGGSPLPDYDKPDEDKPDYNEEDKSGDEPAPDYEETITSSNPKAFVNTNVRRKK